jgi:hypothetical protein
MRAPTLWLLLKPPDSGHVTCRGLGPAPDIAVRDIVYTSYPTIKIDFSVYFVLLRIC